MMAGGFVIEKKGHARLTEYGLVLIDSDPGFTVAETPGCWLLK